MGRWPSDYGMKESDLRDSVGPLAATLSDILRLDELVAAGLEVNNKD